jgi:ABC-type transport system substrate-binding protein
VSYQTMVWKVVPSAASRQALLESGGANIVINPPASALPSLSKNSAYKVVQTPAPNLIMIGLEQQNQPLLQNPQVRQALNYAINRNAIINTLADGAGAMPQGAINSKMTGFCKTGTYTYDPNKAKQMLAAAGATGMTLRMVAPSGRYLNDYQIGQAIASEFQAVGVNATLANPTDFATYLAQIYGAKNTLNFDTYIIGLGDPSLTASASLGNFLAAQEPPKGYNALYYENTQFADLVHKADAELDQSKRNDLYCQAQKVLWDDAPALWLYELKVPVVMNAKLSGLRGLPSGVIDPTWVTQG